MSLSKQDARAAMAAQAGMVDRRTAITLGAGAAGSLAIVGGGVVAGRKALAAAKGPTPWYAGTGTITRIPTYCHMCLWRCGVEVAVKNGRAYKIYGAPDNPNNRGKTCARGQAGIMDLYDPDRLKYPLIRTGERGDGKYRRATWEEALDRAAEGLKAVRDKWGGPEAVAWFAHNGGDYFFAELLPGAWGSPNAGKPSEGICTTPRERASSLLFGRSTGVHEPVDWDETDYVVLIGNHIGENAHVGHMRGLANARARGMKLVVVDPRMSTAASKADLWLPIKPGTDTALLLAWMHVLIGERLYDREYVQQWVTGFDQLAAHVEPFTPEWAAGITELPAEQIRRVARELAAHAPKAVVPPGRHTTWYGNDTQRMRALFMVNVLLGNVGRRGGLFFAQAPYTEGYPIPPLATEPDTGG